MNEIEKMAKIMQKGEMDRQTGELDCKEFSTDIIIEVGLQRLAGAKALVNAGYGDVKQALEDYASKLHNNIVVYLKRDFDTREEVCKIIDETLKEVCGE